MATKKSKGQEGFNFEKLYGKIAFAGIVGLVLGVMTNAMTENPAVEGLAIRLSVFSLSLFVLSIGAFFYMDKIYPPMWVCISVLIFLAGIQLRMGSVAIATNYVATKYYVYFVWMAGLVGVIGICSAFAPKVLRGTIYIGMAMGVILSFVTLFMFMTTNVEVTKYTKCDISQFGEIANAELAYNDTSYTLTTQLGKKMIDLHVDAEKVSVQTDSETLGPWENLGGSYLWIRDGKHSLVVYIPQDYNPVNMVYAPRTPQELNCLP